MAHNSAYYPQQQQPQRQYTQPTQVYPQSQPQNIYQQLGKPQPQPHLQGHPTYQQSSALVIQPQGGHPFSQQLPAQVQSSSPLGEATHAPPQTPYQLSQAPHVSPQTPYPQSQTPYLPSQPPYTQSQAVSQTPYTSSQTPYQQTQYQGQQLSQQAYSSRSQSHVSYVPQTSFISQTPGAVPTSSSGSSWRVPASWPPPVAHSATLAQQAQSQVHAQVEPQVTSQTLAQTPAQRPLPLPSTGANATILPFSSQSADNPPPGSNRPFPTLALQATMAPSSNPPSPRRGRPLPTPTGTIDKRATVDLGRLPHGFLSSFANSAISTQPSILSQPQPITTKRSLSPSKRPLPAPSSHSPVKKSESVVLSRTSSFAIQNSTSSASSTAATPRRISPPRFQFQPPSESSSPTKENATTSSSTSSTSATTSNSTSDTSVPSPKKFTPIWKHTIRDYPAPAWGYAVGMASKPHPKPNAQVPTQPAPAGAPPANDVKGKLKKKNETVALPPPPVLVVSSTKGTTQHQQYPPSQYRQLGQPGSTSFIQPGVQQRHSYQQQQQQQAYYGHARTPATYRETQAEGEEDEEEDSEEETDSDEEDEGEDDDEDEDEEQPDPRYNPQIKRQKYKRPMASIASGAQSLSRGYDQNFKEVMICTPKRKLKLKPKIKKMDPYTAYIDVNTNGHKSRIVPRRGGQQTHGRQARPASGLICGGCNGSIIGRIVSAMESRWHPACFRCTVCNELLEHVSSYEHEGRPYCHLDYHENFAPRCYSCKTAIIEEQFISLDDPALGKRTYHTQHFFCAECGDPFLAPSVSFPDSTGEVALSGDGEFEGFTVYKGYPYCEACHVRLRLPKCKRCKRSIRDHDEAVEALGGKWCWGCFVCATCNEPFENPSFFQRDDKPFCERCFSIMLRNEV